MVGVYGMVDEISRMLRSLLETRVTRVLGTQSIAIFMKEMMINFVFFFGVTMVTLPYESNCLFHWIWGEGRDPGCYKQLFLLGHLIFMKDTLW